jgi:hypothetical protein
VKVLETISGPATTHSSHAPSHGGGNDRISRDLEGTFETEQAAVDACFTAARLAVDREISSAERMVERS